MLKFATRYTQALIALLVAMVGYCLVVVPAIEPGASQQALVPTLNTSLASEAWWEGFFPEGAWQTRKPMFINTDKGILLFDTWELVNEKTYELKPLTMILPLSKTARQAIQENQPDAVLQHDMWIVSAQQGATIHFEEPPNLTNGTVPKIVFGRLSGEIELTRKVANELGKRPWSLRTNDLTIDQRELSTQSSVTIQWNDSLIQGRALKILLRGDLLGSQSDAAAGWGPLDELELYHVDKIDIALPPGGIWADVNVARIQEQAELKLLPARVQATCGGRFAFDFKKSIATLQNGVTIRHQLGNLPPDEFSCDHIAFELRPPSRIAIPTDERMSGVSIKNFEAMGVDSLQEFVGEKWVELRAPTVQVAAKAKRLRVDLERQRIDFDGKIDRPDATQSLVILNYQGSELQAPRIEYQAAPEQTNGGARHLGWMFADGPGEMRLAESSDFGSARVRWQQSMKMTPSPESEKTQWIELLGDTLVESQQHGYLASDRLEVWLQQTAENELISAISHPGNSAQSRYLPARLYASGETLVSTSSIRAQVSQLNVDLVYANQDQDQGSQAQNEVALTDSRGNPMHQWIAAPGISAQTSSIGQPAHADAGAASITSPAAGPPSQPVSVSGDTLIAKVISAGKQGWIDHLHISGPVRVWRDAQNQRDSFPWHIEGEQLALATNRAGQVDMQIDGSPAKVIVAEGSLEGATLRFDQASNLIWMNHPGSFTIPVSVLNSTRQPGQQGIEWFEPLQCSWQGRMVFDGNVARIKGGVQFESALRANRSNGDAYATADQNLADAQLWWFRGNADELSFRLASPLDMSGRAEENVVEIERVVLDSNVRIRASQLDALGERKSREEISVPSLIFHVQQSQIVARGPGWIKSNFPSKGRPGQLASTSSMATSLLQGAHLKFRDSMVGYLDRKQLIFEGKVEVGVSPLQSWDEMVDVNQMQQLTMDQMLLNCDQLNVYDTSALSTLPPLAGMPRSAWEIQAAGNVAFNGKTESGTYDGTGHQVTYVQAKELLILRGDGRDSAMLRRVPPTGARPTFSGDAVLHVDEVRINPRTLDTQGEIKLGSAGFRMEFDENMVPRANASGSSVPPLGNSIPNPRQDFYKRGRN